MPDGSHWALQAWQRGLPNLGLEPWKPLQASWELRLSRWQGDLPKLELWTNWAYSRQFHHVFGRLTYLGQPVYGWRSTAKGSPLDSYGRNIYLDTLNSAYGAGWRRENSFLSHKASGTFCYGFYPHDPYPGYPATGKRPEGKGERYRATVVGPGVLPDVTWEGAAPPPTTRPSTGNCSTSSARSTPPTAAAARSKSSTGERPGPPPGPSRPSGGAASPLDRGPHPSSRGSPSRRVTPIKKSWRDGGY